MLVLVANASDALLSPSIGAVTNFGSNARSRPVDYSWDLTVPECGKWQITDHLIAFRQKAHWNDG